MMMPKPLLFRGVSFVVFAAICRVSVLPVHAEGQSHQLSPDGSAFISLEHQEQLFFEGDVKRNEDIPVGLSPINLVPDVAVSVESIRFYSQGRNLRATVQCLTDTLPDGLYVLAKIELLGDKGQCFDRDSFEVPRLPAAIEGPEEPKRRKVDLQLYDLQLAEEVVRRFRISLHAVSVFSKEGLAEGTMAIGVGIPVDLKGDLKDLPDAVKCGPLRFEKTEKNDELGAWLGMALTGARDSRWVADLEVMNEEGTELSHARRIFSTSEMPGEVGSVGYRLYFSLGRWTKATGSSRFRLHLKPARDDVSESFEAPFEIGCYSVIWLTVGTPQIPHSLVMLRGIHFDRLDNGHVQARLRAGGKQLADTEWQIHLELLGPDGQVLQSVVTTLATKKEQEYRPHGSVEYTPDESDIALDLGKESDASRATYFRISLRRIST